MSKKFFLAAFVLLLSSCAGKQEVFVHYCPNVQIVPEFSRMTIMAGKEPEAKVELIGYEGYCRTDVRNQAKAVVAPIFEVSRLNETSDKKVRFSYYTDTGSNKIVMLGKEKHSVVVDAPKIGEKIMYQGDYVELRIPEDQPGYPIKLGLMLSNAQYRYNRIHGMQ